MGMHAKYWISAYLMATAINQSLNPKVHINPHLIWVIFAHNIPHPFYNKILQLAEFPPKPNFFNKSHIYVCIIIFPPHIWHLLSVYFSIHLTSIILLY